MHSTIANKSIRVIKEPSTEDGWKSQIYYYGNDVIYFCDGDEIRECDESNVKIVRLSINREAYDEVYNEVVIAVGREVSDVEAIAALRRIISVIKDKGSNAR